MNSNTLSKEDKVIQLYLELSSQKKVAKELSMCTKTVRKILKSNNVQRKTIKREVECRNCGKVFVTDNERKVSCSEKCRSRYNKRNRGHKRTCETCGIIFYKYREQSHCSKQCFMEYLEQKSKQKELLTRLVKAIDPSRQKKCIECNQTFYARYRNKIFCSDKCSSSHWRSKIIINKPKYKKNCKYCGKDFITTRSNATYCTNDCRKRFQWRRREALRDQRIKVNGEVHWDITLEKLVKRDKNICYLCNEEVHMDKHYNHNMYGSIDHVIPLAKGGTHTWNNIKLAHRICNSIKADK